MDNNRWPESGEFVVCTVKTVTDFGAYTLLEEYGDKEGFIHISEIKAGWVKYVRDFVREGQKIVCKVLNVDTARRHIDLSLKDVNEHQKRAKIQDWKNEQKAHKWLQFVAEEANKDPVAMQDLQTLIMDEFGSCHAAFEESAMSGADAFEDIDIDKNIISIIVKLSQENIKLPFVEIAGHVDLTSDMPNGRDLIKDALREADSVTKDDDVEIHIAYTGAPRYRIKVTAPDYKVAEAILKESSQKAIDKIHEMGGEGIFYRHIESIQA
ncbi:MAG: translation initiation factor IF-2 subunit alpha [Methanosarcinaceae archaeon]|nr:translation initiation factor IF-2 subunit alpha [Methanosarcinaceae archaeon]